MLAADEFDHDVDVLVGHDVMPVARELLGCDAGSFGLLPDQAAGARDLEVDVVGVQIAIMMGKDGAGDAAAHRAQADEAHVDGAEIVLHRWLLTRYLRVDANLRNGILAARPMPVTVSRRRPSPGLDGNRLDILETGKTHKTSL